MHKSMGPDRMHSGTVRGLPEFIARQKSIINYGDQENFLKSGGKKMSSLSSKREGRRNQGTTSQSASPQSLGRK